MDALISLDELKRDANITHDFEDLLFEDLCVRATEIVIDYLEAQDKVSTSPVVWDLESVPVVVKAAILHVGVNLYRHRGDEGDQNGPITTRVVNLLARYRRPALA